jgi:hypothetical protein|tara:strand:+ start:912 stop:1175 length:264 start_codon:yes stop_codon:yes gene_type:complete
LQNRRFRPPGGRLTIEFRIADRAEKDRVSRKTTLERFCGQWHLTSIKRGTADIIGLEIKGVTKLVGYGHQGATGGGGYFPTDAISRE